MWIAAPWPAARISYLSTTRFPSGSVWLQSAKSPPDVTKLLFPSFYTSWSLTYCWPPADRVAHSEAAADWTALWPVTTLLVKVQWCTSMSRQVWMLLGCARPCLLVTQAQPTGARATCSSGGTWSWPRPRPSPDQCVYYWQNVRFSAQRHPSAA